jgi:hypothetical protein
MLVHAGRLCCLRLQQVGRGHRENERSFAAFRPSLEIFFPKGLQLFTDYPQKLYNHALGFYSLQRRAGLGAAKALLEVKLGER